VTLTGCSVMVVVVGGAVVVVGRAVVVVDVVVLVVVDVVVLVVVDVVVVGGAVVVLVVVGAGVVGAAVVGAAVVGAAVVVVVRVKGDAAAWAGTIMDCTTGFVHELGRLASTIPAPSALRSGRRSGSFSNATLQPLKNYPSLINSYRQPFQTSICLTHPGTVAPCTVNPGWFLCNKQPGCISAKLQNLTG
jgi:hypothetical protein